MRGRRSSIVYGNGTTTAYTYDEISLRLTRIHTTRTSDGAAVQDLRYVYDAVGNIVEVDDLAQQSVFFANAQVSPRQRYTYDALYQLATAEGREHTSQGHAVSSELTPGVLPDTNDPAALRAWTETYSYDAVGNLVEVQHVAAGGNWTRAYVYDAAGNRLLSNAAPGDPAGGPYSHAYAYDAHGNMTAMPHLAAIDWDYADRMQHADLGGGGDVWFVYDSAGNRVRKVRVNQAGTQSEERVYLGGVELYRERQGGVVQRERQSLHVADDSGRVCLVETLTVDGGTPVAAAANVSRYQYGNHLGSASLELDGAANTISYEEYHPFGTSAYRAVDSAIAVSAKRYRYTGKERDEETGLDLMGARYYASWLGRWTAGDPIGLGDGVNRYAYVRGRPTALRDPSGTLGVGPEAPNGNVIDPVRGGYEFNAPEGESFRVQIAGTDEVQRASQVIIFDDRPVVGRPQPAAKRKVSTPSSGGPAEESQAVTDYYRSVWEGFESYGVGAGEHVGAIASGVRDVYYDVTTHHEGIAVGAWVKAQAVGAAVWGDAKSVVFDGYGGTFAALSDGDFSGAAGSYGQGAGAAWRLAGLALGASGTGAAIGNWGRRLIGPRSVAPSGGAGATASTTSRSGTTSAAGGGGPGNVAIDANTAIRAIEAGESAAVDAALAGRTPVIPIQAVKEFLVKGDVNALRGFLSSRGGRVAAGASDEAAAALQGQATALGRSLKPKDARVAASAQKEGVPLITRDTKLRKFLNAIGIGGESF